MYSQAVDKNNPKGKTRFFESYTEPSTGRYKTVSVTMDRNTAQSRKIASTRLQARIQGILRSQLPVNTESLTLSEVIVRYNLDQKRDEAIRESTQVRNTYHTAAIEQIIGKDTLINNLTAPYVNERFRESGESNLTTNNRVARFKSLLRWANQQGYVTDISWLSSLKTYSTTEPKEKLLGKFMESSELKLVLKSATHKRYRLAIHMLALSGLRIGEFIALNDSDVTSDEIIVNKTYYINGRKVQDSPKTDSSNRRIYIQPELAEVIAEIRDYVSAQDLATDIFFPNVKGGYMHYQNFARYFGKITEEVIGRKLTPHALRHTHTSLLAEQGVPLEVIARRLGHGDSEITRSVYLHVTQGMEDSDRKLLSGIRLL